MRSIIIFSSKLIKQLNYAEKPVFPIKGLAYLNKKKFGKCHAKVLSWYHDCVFITECLEVIMFVCKGFKSVLLLFLVMMLVAPT
ncbi:MAG: hypothetical protein Q9M75_10140, partial [Ghiorsea sp.]|nr:hypothetical protein [Ghiorsea sp.]